MALDQLFSQLILANRKQLSDSDYFPISDSRQKFEARCKAGVQGRVGKDAYKLICATEAYLGGKGEALWLAHNLDIEDKHKVEYALGFDYQGFTPAMPRLTDAAEGFNVRIAAFMDQFFLVPADNLAPLKEGDALFLGPPDPQNDPKFRFGVAFSEPQIVAGKTVLPTLLSLTQEIEGAVEASAPLLPN